jgi:CHAT domain-containing protein/tetratricopeptide (TPR) repeat protein
VFPANRGSQQTRTSRLLRPSRPAAGRTLLVWFVLLVSLLVSARHSSAAATAVSFRVAFQSGGEQGGRAPGALGPGQRIERGLQGGETHRYRIRLQAGSFLRVIVEKRGISVVASLYDPAGTLVKEGFAPNGAFGPTPLSATVGAAGDYEIRIAALNDKAGPGRYEVRIVTARRPRPEDETRLAAERDFQDGLVLLAEHRAASARAAIGKFDSALVDWQMLGDRYQQALALHTIGLSYFNLGELRAALDRYSKAIPLWRTVRDRSGEALTRNNIGSVFDTLGERTKALDFYSGALALYREMGDRSGEAGTLGNIGKAYFSLGDKQKALEYDSHALGIWRDLDDSAGQALILNNIGSIRDALGEKQTALDLFAQVLPLERALGNRRGEAVVLGNMGKVHGNLGEPRVALSLYAMALPLWREMGDREGEAATLSNIGRAHDDLGEKKEALDFFTRALTLQRAIETRSAQAITLNNIGSIYDDLGETQKALASHEEALALEQAVGDRASEAATLANIGKLCDELGEHRRALEFSTRALLLARQVQEPLTEAGVLHNLMMHWAGEGQVAEAVLFGKQAVNRYQWVRQNIQGLESSAQQGFVRLNESTYRELAELLIKGARIAEAEQILGLLKNEEYFEFIQRDGPASLVAPVPLTPGEQDLARRIEQQAEGVAAIGKQWEDLDARSPRSADEEKRYADLGNRIKDANAAFARFLDDLSVELGRGQLARVETRGLEAATNSLQQDVLAKLDPGSVAIYTLVGADKYHVILVTPTVRVAREFPILAADLWKKVVDFREALRDPASDPLPLAGELYRILVGPIAQDLEGAKAVTLMWSLDGVLRYLPVAALHDGHGYLVERYALEVFTPGYLTRLTELPAVRSWRAAGLGVSRAIGAFPALPAVPGELRGIIHDTGSSGADGVVPGQIMLDGEFTLDAMKRVLGQKYPLVHIASHFRFQAGNDTESFLLLGGPGPDGARLSLADVRNDPAIRFAGTELLTLSACETALGGNNRDGREVDGLGMLAQEKGAKAVLATLWQVADESTRVLMEHFYRAWTTQPGMTKGEALRQAQLALLRGEHAKEAPAGAPGPTSFRHPYFWAPFILIGNWR